MRTIDADKLLRDIEKYHVSDGKFQHWVQIQPTIESERKTGKWIKTGQSFVYSKKFRNYSCSECGYDIDKIKFNFCPNCGADMRGGLNE